MNRKYAINGRFIVREFGGQERYSYEIFNEIDKMINYGELEMVVPEYADRIPEYQNIKIVKYGKVPGHLWEQISYWWYLIKNKRIGINPCITCPILKPDIVTLHDVLQVTGIIKYKNLYGILSKNWHKMMFKSAAKSAKLIFTVSDFSKQEIIKYLHINPDKIIVIGNGWDHLKKIKEDDSYFKKHQELIKGEYFLSASSLTPQKNFQWVINAAILNPKSVFAIAGKKVSLTQDNLKSLKNLHFLGYVSDEEMKTLMKNCKAFIHPAKYEGFGITPMEALSVGAPVFVSYAACLPEIYKNTVHYIDPDNPNIDLEKRSKEDVEKPDNILCKYTWHNMAEKVLHSLRMYDEKM